SMSIVAYDKTPVKPNPILMHDYPDTYLTMGLTGENLAERWKISRQEADEFSYQSHMKAIAAIDSGKFRDEIVPVQVQFQEMKPDGQVATQEILMDTDECPRRETTMDALSVLKPVFKIKGTITAGNSSQRSDGAAAVVLMSAARAATVGLQPLGRFTGYAVSGVRPEIMGIGPAHAIPKLLEKAGRKLDEIDVIELNEAFAAQALAVARAYPLPMDRVNPNGG